MQNKIQAKSKLKEMRKGVILFCASLLISAGALGQNTFNGKVVSMKTGQPLKSIEVKQHLESSVPTYTDSLGQFELMLDKSGVYLEFSYAGYKSQVVYTAAGKQITVKLVEAGERSLDDELSVPMGMLKEKYFTGSKSFVDNDDMNSQLYTSIDSRLTGMLTGVRVLPTSGSPGSGAELLVRGISTLNGGTQPMYIVDGLVIRNYQYSDPLALNANHNPLNDLNPNDIKSVNVIKDGAQSAFYGVRGANGVVLIETNMGTSGKTELSLDVYAGVSSLSNELPVLDASQYKTYFKDLNYQNGMSPYDFALNYKNAFYNDPNSESYYSQANNTNWQEEVLQPAILQSYYLNLKGGDQVTTYAFSTGYINEQGIVSETSLDRFNINFNLIYRISDKLRFGNVVNFAYTQKTLADEGLSVHSSPLFIANVKGPQFSPNLISLDGSQTNQHADADFFGMSNPMHIVSDLENKVNINRLMGSIYLDFDVTSKLKGRVDFGVDYNRQAEKRFYPDYGLSSSENALRYSESKVNNRFLLQGDMYLKYQNNFDNGSLFSAMAGVGVTNQSLGYNYGKGINSAADYFTTLEEADADSLSSGDMVTRMVSTYGKANYNYQDKYLIEANVRLDGSSRFGTNNRYGFFPGISGGWRMSEEEFMSDVSFIEELKLKVGYGVSGNENIADYAAYNTFSGAAYNLRGAILPINLGNKDLKWETTRQFDAGVYFLGARSKIGAEIDFYVKNTSDLFYVKELPSHTGYSGILDNLGDVRNVGVDVSLFFRPVDQTIRWDSRLLISTYKNEVISLPGGQTSMEENVFLGIAEPGAPIGAFYGYKADGLFDSQAEADMYQNSPGYEPFSAGDLKYEDIVKDNIIDEKDMTIIGDPHPDLYGSFLNTFSYKNFSLDINFTYSIGNDAYNLMRKELESMDNYYNQSEAVLRSWKKTGDAELTDMPRMAIGDPAGNTRNSSRWVEDASYLRLQLLGLNYKVKPKHLKSIGLSSLTVYIKGQNLYTFTKYLGYAPDFINGNNPLLYGVDSGAIPMARTFLAGVKIGL